MFKKTAFLALAASLALMSFGAGAGTVADAHTSKGIPCESCHGPDKKNLATPTNDTCATCHNVQALVEKTAKVKPTNPHTSPHYGDKLECSLCHIGHEPSENYCNQCHQFDFKVP